MSPEAPLSADRPRKENASSTPRAVVRSVKPQQQSQTREPTSRMQTEPLSLIPVSTEITFLRLPQVKATTGLSKTTIYEKIKENAFPCPVLISKRAVAWIESEVRQWAASQISARVAGARLPPKRVGLVSPSQSFVKTA